MEDTFAEPDEKEGVAASTSEPSLTSSSSNHEADAEPPRPETPAGQCACLEDFDRLRTRRLLARQAIGFFQAQQATPTELLYRTDLLQALQQADYLPEIQKRSLSRRPTGPEYLEDLANLAEQQEALTAFLAEMTAARLAQLEPLDQTSTSADDLYFHLTSLALTEDPDFDDLPDEHSEDHGDLVLTGSAGQSETQTPEEQDENALDQTRLTLAELVAHVRPMAEAGDKIAALVDLAAPLSQGPGLELLDRLIGEYCATPAHAAKALDCPEPILERLAFLSDVIAFDPDGEDTSPQKWIYTPLGALLARAPMPETRTGLTDAILILLETTPSFLATPKPSVADPMDGDGSDEDDEDAFLKKVMDTPTPASQIQSIMAELLAIGEAVNVLRKGGRRIGGSDVNRVLDARLLRLLSPDTLSDALQTAGTADKIKTLVEFQSVSNGEKASLNLAKHLVEVVEDRDLPGQLMDEFPAVRQRIEKIGEIAQSVGQAKIGQRTRSRLRERLDDLQLEQVRSSRMLDGLKRTGPPTPESYEKVLDLASKGMFVAGRTSAEVSELLEQHAKRPDFVRSYLGWLRDNGQSGSAARDLGERLRQAGVDFRDVAEMRVMVVDDEKSAAAYMEMVLADMGFEDITVAHDGTEALAALQNRSNEIDLIICDWMMPKMSGLELLKHIRKSRLPIPFLMVTALASHEKVAQALSSAVTAYIAKPFPPEQLEEKVLVLMHKTYGIVHSSGKH